MPVLSSLVITVYNRERYLGAAIESVLAQTRGDFELLVWDDGSTDRSVQIAQNYARQDARVRVVAAQHQGRGRALKNAIAQTTGTYIGIVDSDDILAPTALEETAAVLDAHPVTGLVYTDYLVMNEIGEVTGYGSRCRFPYSPSGLLRKFMTFHFRVIRRTVFEQVGGINKSFYVSEDYELCLRLSEVTQVQRVSKPLYYYRVHRESITQQRKAEQNHLCLKAVKQALKRRQRADYLPATLLSCAEFSTQPSQNLPIAPLFKAGLIHSLQTPQEINPLAYSESRFQLTSSITRVNQPEIQIPDSQLNSSKADWMRALVHFNGLDLLARSLNSGRFFGLTENGASSKVAQDCVSSIAKRFTQSLAKNLCHALAALPLLGAITLTPALAQIVPAADGTNTLVNTTGNQLDITGGQTSSNGTNLFHSFSQFDLNAGQTANFQSNPTIQNILGRVVSGNASNINGLIQVSGSQANLYLMNPAGIIFGSNASLNVPADFVATTATSIGIGNNWFNAAGTNDYTQLNGAPNAFAFTTPQPGSIVNSGNLTVGAQKNLMLLGGTVVSTGQVNAQAGKITVAAVPGERLVRLSQPGMVLSLEVPFPASNSNQPTPWTVPVLSLPQLLTGGGGENATGITVNANGQVALTSSGVQVPTNPGTTIISGTVNASGTAPNQTGGEVNILGDKVGLVSASIDASGTNGNGGGTILIGGDYQGKGTVPNASRTYVSNDSVINANSFLNGDGGRVIVWADKTTEFYGNINARGGDNSGNGGFAEVSGKESLVFKGLVDLSAPVGSVGTLLLDPENITIVDLDDSYGADDTAFGNGTQILANDFPGASLVISRGRLENIAADANIILQALNNITIDDLDSNELSLQATTGSITFTADADGNGVGNFSMNAGDTIRTQGGAVTISGANLTVGSINTSSPLENSGNVTLTARGNITTGAIYTGTTARGGNGGNISITSSNGSINTSAGNLDASNIFDTAANAGTITLQAQNDIITGNLWTYAFSPGTGNGNNVSVTSNAGAINILGDINSTSSSADNSNGGAVTLNAAGNITTNGLVRSFSNGAGTGGDITMTSSGGVINTSAAALQAGLNTGTGGAIALTASNGITPGNITTRNNNIRLNGSVLLPATTTFTTGPTTGDIIINGTVDSAATATATLILAAGGGNITLADAVGSVRQLDGLGIQSANNVNFNGSVSVGNDDGGGVAVNHTGQLTTAGNIRAYRGFRQTGTGGVFVGGDIITGGDNDRREISFEGPVTLTNNATFSSGVSFGIFFNSTLDIGSNTLTLKTDNRIDFAGGNNSVTGTGSLVLAPTTPSQNIEIAGPDQANALKITAATLAALQNGFSSIVIGEADSSGTITVVNPVTFNDPVIIQAPVGTGSINATGAITGLDNASITLRANNNITTGNITATPGISIISNSGSIDTSAGILDSSSPEDNGGNIDLSAPLSITTGGINSTGLPGTGDISLTSNEINFAQGAFVAGSGTLLLQPFTPSQNIAIGGATDSGVGTLDLLATDIGAIASNAYTSLIIGRSDGSGAITLNPVRFLNPTIIQTSTGAGSITTTPGVIGTYFGDNFTLISNQINTSASTIDTSNRDGRGGLISFTAPGGITLGNLIATGTSYDGYNFNFNGGDINLTGPVTLANNNTSITTGISNSLGAGNITFSSTINATTPGVQALNLTVGTGTVTLGNAIGGVTPLGSLSVTGGNGSQVFVGSNITIANNNLTFEQPVTLTGSATFNAGTGTIGFYSSLATGNNALTLTADEINFAGGANSVTGTSNLTLQPFTPNQNIAIADDEDSGTGTLDLTTADIAALQNGFNSITIGGANSSGTITIDNPVTFNDPVTIQAPEGAGTITATGAITGLDNASITLRANQNITTSNITANPGITIISSNGSINTSNGILDSSSTSNPGGAIALSALGDITTNNITSHSDASEGGDITVNSQTGVLSSGNLDASGNTRGGNITVIAKNQITAGQINSSATTGDGGNVLLDPIGDIQVDFINSQGGTSGKGGAVDITTNQFFRALSTFTDQNGINASLSTAGGTGGGDIVIRHDGGARGIPFDVGNASTNGTAGAITTGLSNSILPLQSFPGSYTQGNIQLITQNPPPPPTPLPTPLPTPSPSPKPDTNTISKDIQGATFATTGISTINTAARILLNTTSILREDIEQALADGQIQKAIALLEQLRMQEFQNYFEGNLSVDTTESASLEQTQAVLSSIAENTGKTPAVIYVFTQPDQLQLILVTPTDKPILKTVYDTNNDALLKMVSKFRSEVTEPRKKTGYQASAKQLYQWLIAPLESELQAKKIDTLVFSMDAGLRSLPLAALYDGKQFLVEKYSIGLIPSINLTDTRYGDVKTTEVLAMGASKFDDQNPLPAVPVELSTIVGKQNVAAENRELLPANQSPIFSKGFWSGESFLNQGFTLTNLKAQRTQTPFGVIHLATHGQFNLGAPRNSYIQLWDTKLRLDQLRQMGWNNPPVELLVLSACRTALGNEDAEFGFGGLAVAAGVKSALASLWYVSDEGTLAVITEFYQQLKTAPIKAEALREAQIAMIKGQVRIEGGKLRGIEQGDSSIPLPPELEQIGDKDLSHPYYWSAFTMIGSPW